jgi:hypothetical protein
MPNTSDSFWKKPHIYKVGSYKDSFDDIPDDKKEALRKQIEPWLSAVFQSEHLSLLLGSGFTTAIASQVTSESVDMKIPEFEGEYADKIKKGAEKSARNSERGKPNFEDYIRIASELMRGYEILEDEKASGLRQELNEKLRLFLNSILNAEQYILKAFNKDDETSPRMRNMLVSFLLSFASRAASRERLNLFTTNYDRLIEYGCDLAGLRVIDRFVGMLTPIFRASRLNIDLHYNPPGIRGEPRYLEGVVRLFKLHGSLDWRLEGKQIRRYGIPFGAPKDHPDIPKCPLNSVIVYPNSAKDMETSEYPYAEMFRDFAAAICRPNSVLVTYGYGFGDDHINRVIRDMLTVPSTHMVIISYDNHGKTDSNPGRIERFFLDLGREAQLSLLIGSHFGNLPDLANNYLPKPAIDLISIRETELRKRRELDPVGSTCSNGITSEITLEGDDYADTD